MDKQNKKFLLIKINQVKKSLKQISLKEKIVGQKNPSGRNNSGKITVFHKGGGHKKKYRFIEFNRIKDSNGILISIEYDPNRNAFIGGVYDIKYKRYFYILLPKKSQIGDIINSGQLSEVKLGHSLFLRNIPVGSFIHNVSINLSKKGSISRSAGTYSTLIEKTKTYCKIMVSSGDKIILSNNSYATLGVVSNEKFLLNKIVKAGRNRWLNIRPTVRGVAMNPIDHPHGGGEGKTSGGKTKRTPWGKPIKSKKR